MKGGKVSSASAADADASVRRSPQSSAVRVCRLSLRARRVSSASVLRTRLRCARSAAAESLLFGWSKRSKQENGHPGFARALPARAPAGLISRPPPLHRGRESEQPASWEAAGFAAALVVVEPSLLGCCEWGRAAEQAPLYKRFQSAAAALACGSRTSRQAAQLAVGERRHCLMPGMAGFDAGRLLAGSAGHAAQRRAMSGSPALWLRSLGETRRSDSATAEVDDTLRHRRERRVKPNAPNSSSAACRPVARPPPGRNDPFAPGPDRS